MFDVNKLTSGGSRILLDVRLAPVQGTRFQPTGFPNLGAATYTMPDGKEMLLVESPQSMANRLESVTWDPVANDLVSPLQGLPYVAAFAPSKRFLTSSVLEAHRLNSPYFLDSLDSPDSKEGRFFDMLRRELEPSSDGEPSDIDIRKAAKLVFRLDPNSLLHGVFFANSKLAGGKYRFSRLLSSFIEATGVLPADSGGVKNDRVSPSGFASKGTEAKGEQGGSTSAQLGYGNVPFHRSEFVAESINAHFSLDLATLRGYGLGTSADALLITLTLWKIRYFLESSMRLRTACDLKVLEPGDVVATEPSGFVLPSAEDLDSAVVGLISECKSQFADPPVTRLTWATKEAQKLAKTRASKSDGVDSE